MTSKPADPSFLDIAEEDLRQAIELLFFAYRDFTAEPDAILAQYNFGRAHHRVIYFVGRNPGITVNELLSILRITKQSLNRVLRQLIQEEFIKQTSDSTDRRLRRLNLTAVGAKLEADLTNQQSLRIAEAYRAAGSPAINGFREILRGIINVEDRDRISG
jgi:DNA-binding MarR family transcriptional regulator